MCGGNEDSVEQAEDGFLIPTIDSPAARAQLTDGGRKILIFSAASIVSAAAGQAKSTDSEIDRAEVRLPDTRSSTGMSAMVYAAQVPH